MMPNPLQNKKYNFQAHSYFINFYNRFLKQDVVYNNNQKLNSNELQKQIQNVEKKFKKKRTEFRQYDQIYNDQQYLLGYFTKDKGRYEDYKNSVLVNFADKNVDGLSFDPVNLAQEEVLILTHPEALISMLFMETMDENEAILIKNVFRFKDYDRYGQTFRQKDEDYFKQIQQNTKIIKNHF
ncbi:unnamed protein product [Paramecium pentaurelia]|uniref:PARG catalytic Macro domain-containing protein n=1 Tax=Paramecium pentaurelia TaxID=43138 RepID=A0A8S1VXW2_9CILI|nr:unnamed protein product [Paramecium pentaurelia]